MIKRLALLVYDVTLALTACVALNAVLFVIRRIWPDRPEGDWKQGAKK